MPPWQVEDAPLVWIDRYTAWENAKAERARQNRPAVGEERQVGNKKVKRLV